MAPREITGDDITQWLDGRSDFSLEMQMLSHLNKLGLEAEHGGTYSDPVTNKPRQFDIRCHARNGECTFKLAVECKALSKSFPLIVQRVPRAEQESFVDVFLAQEILEASGQSIYDTRIKMPGEDCKILRAQNNSKLYPKGGYVGKSTNQIGEKKSGLFANDSEIYDKWSQAIASADDLVSQASEEHERPDRSRAFTIVLPVLVVSDECLWAVNYSPEGQRLSDPERLDEISFFLSKEFWRQGSFYGSYTISHLHLMTRSGFTHFTRMIASKNTNFWNETFQLSALTEIE